MLYGYTIKLNGLDRNERGKQMATTHRLTSTIKVSEFLDVAEALLSMQDSPYSTREPLLDLIAKQTPAKQKKFWKFYDAHKVGA